MEKKTIHAIVQGKVQGVFFRDHTSKEAQRLGLTGWVRNRADGSVEAVISGEADKVGQLVSWLHTGSPRSEVDNIHTEEWDVEKPFTSFDIRF